MTVPKPSDNYLHYVKKSDIVRSTVEGTEATALCGECFVACGLTGGQGSVGLEEVCPVCLGEYLTLSPGRSAQSKVVA